jgi:hypothetical protein
VDLSSCAPAVGAAGRRYWSASAQECCIYQYWLQNHDSENHFSASLRWPVVQPAQRADCRGRPQSPGNRYALTRVSNFPRQFTLENCRLPPVSPHSSFGKLREFHVFNGTTLGQIVTSRNRKTFYPCAETVDDETCLWKAEEKRAPTRRPEREPLRVFIPPPGLPVT